jgi:antitoxin PrlF
MQARHAACFANPKIATISADARVALRRSRRRAPTHETNSRAARTLGRYSTNRNSEAGHLGSNLRILLLRAHYRGNVTVMAIAQSKVTAQGQISVPAEVRKKLGVGPGSVLEWDEQGSEVVVRRAGRHSSKDIYLALFPGKTPKKDPPDVKDAIRKHIRKRHARG